MKFAKSILATALVAAASLALPGIAQAQMMPLSDPVVGRGDPESHFTSSDPALHRNKQAALHIMRELLQCNQWSRAGEWLTDAYIQHNPLAASGLEGVMYYFTQVARRPVDQNCGQLRTPIVHVQAEDDFVTVVYPRELSIPGDPAGGTYTTTWFDTWRFVNGKADEHWDPATLPNYNPGPVANADAVLRETQDRVAIEKLMWDYVRAIDTWNPEAYAGVFTENGSFGDTVGRAALSNMVSTMASGRAERAAGGEDVGTLHHVMSNQVIGFINPNRAVVNYYWQTVSRGGPGAAAPRLIAQGWGEDVVVKNDGRWLIESRNVAPD